ncbi:hypothetical protein EMPS_02492 [Entomortierella parvispora]|uniref:Uncharacterized protein n=1 Tax=Entomortierella parvispora TaxID=205924 RepID=A0A9P3H4Y6_9FUNG|nr:hypothetical protein EMPS_02492 [Entomortierella parvispora]
MVQHTQTHTKGAKRESSAGIAKKIEIESRRRSEAGLIGGSGHGARAGSSSTAGSSKGSKNPKKSSNLAGAKKNRVHSLPTLKLESSTSPSSLSLSSGRVVKRPPSSRGHSPEPIRSNSKGNISGNGGTMRESGKIRKKSQSGTNNPSSDPRGSTSSTGGMSWYASKLHHKSSIDFGRLNHNSATGGLDAHLPPLRLGCHHQQQYEYSRDPMAASFGRPRHPLSPDRSSNSDDEEAEGDGEEDQEIDLSYRPTQQDNRRDRQPWGGMVDSSMDHLTLPPLRGGESGHLHQRNGRLPSFGHPSSGSRYRSHSLNFDYPSHLQHHQQHQQQHPSYHEQEHREAYAPKTRRLSLADLETPIQETKKVVHQSFIHGGDDAAVLEAAAAFEGGVDVSEDEIQALEAFGELWSQGRDVAQAN